MSLKFKIEFTYTARDGTVIQKTFEDGNLNNPINGAQKLLNELKDYGFAAMNPKKEAYWRP